MPTDRREWLERLKHEADPVRVAHALGLSSRGRRYFCPSCQPDGGKTPDLSVSSLGFHCWKCNAKGDVVALVEFVKGCGFLSAVEWLAAEAGQTVPKGRSPRRNSPPSPPPPARRVAVEKSRDPATDAPVLRAFLDGCRPADGPALAFLTNRGISADVVRQLEIKFCGREYRELLQTLEARFGADALTSAGLLLKGRVPTFEPYVRKRIGFLVFPYQLAGQPVYLKARPPLEKAACEARRLPRFLNTGGAVPCPYNADVLSSATDRVLVCEGETDTLTALTHGYPAIGLPGWSAFNAAWTDRFRGKTVFLVLDADAGGDRGVRDIVEKFDRAGLPPPKRVELPPGSDLNEFLKDGRTE